jgi:hypothetical protein
MVIDMSGKDISVKNKDSCGAKALAGDTVLSVRCYPTGRDQTESNQTPKDYPHPGGDEIVFKGVLHEKHNSEKKNETADPREKLDPEKCFPIDCGTSRTRRWRF